MENDTDAGGPVVVFPATHCSLVRASSSPDAAVRRQAQETLVSAYWKPVYKYIRVRWGAANEDAKDLTQAFFVLALERGFFDEFDPGKARFRTFVRLCVDGFVGKERRAAGRLKRGGHVATLPLDFAGADDELCRQAPASAVDPDDLFRREWVRNLFTLAVEDLRQHCAAAAKDAHFALFERYDLASPDTQKGLTYARLGQEFGLSASQVTNYLTFARNQFRRLILQRLRDATGSDEEFQEEARNLFGGAVP
jgi:RNA polymerase sigma factor (sigma-70 family)